MATATREEWLTEELTETNPMPVVSTHRYRCARPFLTLSKGAIVTVTRVVDGMVVGWRQVGTDARGVCPVWLFRQHFAAREGEENG